MAYDVLAVPAASRPLSIKTRGILAPERQHDTDFYEATELGYHSALTEPGVLLAKSPNAYQIRTSYAFLAPNSW